MTRNVIRILTVICALMLFAGVSFAQGTADKTADKTATKSTKKGATTPKSKQVDINSASKDQLTAVSGIDDATAQKIIDGRPYKTKRDLVSKNIMTQAAYDKVKDQLVAHGGKASPKKGASAAPKK
jgi:DNA uptake protein ComE-like DNA-binding protein